MTEARNEIIAEHQANNLAEFMEHGPGLRRSTRTWIIGKDTKAGMVYVGGLGSMGIGEMWVEIHDWHQDDPTFTDAPELKYLGEPFGYARPG